MTTHRAAENLDPQGAHPSRLERARDHVLKIREGREFDANHGVVAGVDNSAQHTGKARLVSGSRRAGLGIIAIWLSKLTFWRIDSSPDGNREDLFGAEPPKLREQLLPDGFFVAGPSRRIHASKCGAKHPQDASRVSYRDLYVALAANSGARIHWRTLAKHAPNAVVGDAAFVLEEVQAEVDDGAVAPTQFFVAGSPFVLWEREPEALLRLSEGCPRGGEFLGVSRVHQVEAVTQLEHRAYYGWIFGLGPRKLEGAISTKLPEIDARSQPVVVILARGKRRAREDLSNRCFCATVVRDYRSVVLHRGDKGLGWGSSMG